MDAGGLDFRHCKKGAGKFALFRAPVGRVEHLRGCAKARKIIKQLIARAPCGGQAFGGKRHTQAVTLAGVDKDGIARDFVRDAALIQRGDHFTRCRRFKARVKKHQVGPARQTAKAKDRGEHRKCRADDDGPAAQVERGPDGKQVLQGDSPLSTFCRCPTND